MIILQFAISGNQLFFTQIDGVDYNMIFTTGLHKHLNWRLPVNLNCHVNHSTAIDKAVRRSIAPATANIHTQRTAPPHNLVVFNIKARLLWVMPMDGKHRTLKLLKRHTFISLAILTAPSGHLRPEHIIAGFLNTLKSLLMRKFNIIGCNNVRKFIEIELIKNAVFMIGCQPSYCIHHKGITLCVNTPEVSLQAYF